VLLRTVQEITNFCYDLTRKALVSMPIFNRLLFLGKTFHGYAKYTIEAGATAYAQIKTKGEAVCFFIDTLATDGDKITVKMYEDPSITDGETEIIMVNRNRESSDVIPVEAYSDPTGVSGGTQIDELYAGGTFGQKVVGGEQIIGQLPLRLKPSADYVIAITNDSAASSTVLLRFSIMED